MDRSWDSVLYARTADLQASMAGKLVSALAIQPEENVLDLGCGLGNLTLAMAAIAHRGNVLGIDTSPAMIEQANANLHLGQIPNVTFRVASVGDLQLDSEFDVVFSNSVLHWIREQRHTLEAVRRCLKPDGRIGFQFPLLDSTHPLISVTQQAIRSLHLDDRYASWQSPWFVPESAHAYADLLRSVSFADVNVEQRETVHTFESPLTALGFFGSVGLDLYFQPLSEDEATSLKERVLALLSELATDRGVSLTFRRLYAFAK